MKNKLHRFFMSKKGKTFFYGCLSLTAVCLFLLFPFSKEISLTADFVEWKNNDPSFSDVRRVTIIGICKQPLIGRSSFLGTLSIEGVTEKWDTERIYLPFLCDISKNDAPIFLWFDKTKSYAPQMGWTFVCSKDFQHISILWPSEETNFEETTLIWSMENSMVLSYPAVSREQAVKLTQDLFSDKAVAQAWN